MNVNVPFSSFLGILDYWLNLLFLRRGYPSSNRLRKVGILSWKERTSTMNGLFALGQSVPWLTNDHFEKNLFENSLMPHLTQQLLLPFLLHLHKPFLYMQPLFFLVHHIAIWESWLDRGYSSAKEGEDAYLPNFILAQEGPISRENFQPMHVGANPPPFLQGRWAGVRRRNFRAVSHIWECKIF